MPSLPPEDSVLRRLGLGAHPRDWRLPPIETYPALVAFVQTYAGKLGLCATFAGLMKLVSPGMWIQDGGLWLWLTLAAAAVSLAGRHRQLALLLSTAALLAYAPDWFNFRAVLAIMPSEGVFATVRPASLRVGTLLAFMALAALAIVLARRYREHPLGRRPVLVQHMLYLCLLALAASHLLGGLPQVLLWSLIAAFSAYFWFLAYALIDQRHRHPAPLPFQFATFNPFLWSSTVPMGKGAANWLSVEGRSAEDLAVTQLKALKLLAWALILKGVLAAYRWVVYAKLGVTPLNDAFEGFLHGRYASPLSGLASILADFPGQLLTIALWGHVMIAIARLAGFRLLRNSCRPLSSHSIAEFWNRYFYYFKELMVHVYFYPTYLRCFKRHPRLRIAFATFMAAGVGNFLLHFMLENQAIARFGVLEALNRSQTYAFYCLLLVAGIVLSQLRARQPDPGAGWWRGRFLPSLGVVLFFCFLSVFDGAQRRVPVMQHFRFLMHVFGIDA